MSRYHYTVRSLLLHGDDVRVIARNATEAIGIAFPGLSHLTAAAVWQMNSPRVPLLRAFRGPLVRKPSTRMNRRQRKALGMLSVAVYETNRAYGGPEEGGWWFDCGVPRAGFAYETFYNPHHAYNRASTLNDACDVDNKARGSRGNAGSVLCDYELRALVRRGPPQPYPDHQPHYE